MEKKIITLCDLERGGERGRVMARYGISTAITGTEYKDPQKVIKRYERHNRIRCYR